MFLSPKNEVCNVNLIPCITVYALLMKIDVLLILCHISIIIIIIKPWCYYAHCKASFVFKVRLSK